MMVSVLLFWIGLHPLHVSVTEITYDQNDRELEIVCRLFIDDLELSLQAQTGNPELDLLQPGGSITTDQLVSAYLQKHFSISLDQKLQKIRYLGSEQEDVALVCYLVVEKIKRWKTILVMNNSIQETHSDQSNLVHVTWGEKVKSLRLTRERPEQELVFESTKP
jgi:hypothetical protein